MFNICYTKLVLPIKQFLNLFKFSRCHEKIFLFNNSKKSNAFGECPPISKYIDFKIVKNLVV